MLTCTVEKLAAIAFIAISFICHSKCTDEWQHDMTMDPQGNFQIFWNLSDTNITIEVQVRTKGYVALGFSPHGGMKGADIVSGWVKDSQVFLQDRYATGNVEPIIDDIQDYELISGFENDTHTVLQFTRQLSRCDQQDTPIMDMITHLIYAWGTDDPSATTIEYHGAQNRGNNAFNLFSPNVDLFQITDDMVAGYFHMPKVNLPPQETTYWCKIFKVPETGVKKHFVGVNTRGKINVVIQNVPPKWKEGTKIANCIETMGLCKNTLRQVIVQPANENIVHHMFASQCLDQFSAKFESLLNGPGTNCDNIDVIPPTACPFMFIGWNNGSPNEILPAHVGIPFGKIDKPSYFLVNVHYNNPSLISGIVDQITVRFMITEKLRKYDAGMLTVASDTNSVIGMIIPPLQENFTVTTFLPSECTEKMLPADGINIMSTYLHGHLALTKIYVRHFRNGVELPLIDYDNNYDFNFQHRSNMLKEVNLLPGDSIAVQCEYNTMDRTNFTLSGPGTQDEMCNSFFIYYPLGNLLLSVSDPPLKNILNIMETAESKQLHNNISTRYEMTNEEYCKTFDASILTEKDISAMSYLQTYGRMQGICIGHDGALESFTVEYAVNDTRALLDQKPRCTKSIKLT